MRRMVHLPPLQTRRETQPPPPPQTRREKHPDGPQVRRVTQRAFSTGLTTICSRSSVAAGPIAA
jgi:hypothetical protein